MAAGTKSDCASCPRPFKRGSTMTKSWMSSPPIARSRSASKWSPLCPLESPLGPPLVRCETSACAESKQGSVTPATGAAGARGKVIRAGHASELERLGYILADGFLDFVHFLLRIEKSPRDWIANEAFTVLFKFGDLIV